MNRKWNNNREKPELLIPAKDLEVLRTAVAFGADAVYIGGEAFSLRAKARNFSPEDMREESPSRMRTVRRSMSPQIFMPMNRT